MKSLTSWLFSSKSSNSFDIQTSSRSIYSACIPQRQEILSVTKFSIDVYSYDGDGKRSEAIPDTNCAEYHSDLGWVFIGCCDGLIRIYDVRSLKFLFPLKGHEGEVTCLKLQYSSEILISGGIDGIVMKWNYLQKEHLSDYPSNTSKPHQQGKLSSVTCLNYDEDAGNILIGFQNGTIRIINSASGKLTFELSSHNKSLPSVVSLASAENIFIFSRDNGISGIWDLSKDVEKEKLRMSLTSIIYNEERGLLFLGNSYGDILLWKFIYGDKENTLEKLVVELTSSRVHKGKITSLFYHPDADMLVSSCGDDLSVNVLQNIVKDTYATLSNEHREQLTLHHQRIKEKFDLQKMKDIIEEIMQPKKDNTYTFAKTVKALNAIDTFLTVTQLTMMDDKSRDLLEEKKREILEELKVDSNVNFKFLDSKKQAIQIKFGKFLWDSDEQCLKELEEDHAKQLKALQEKHQKELQDLEESFRKTKIEFPVVKEKTRQEVVALYQNMKGRYLTRMEEIDENIAKNLRQLILTSQTETNVQLSDLPLDRYKPLKKITSKVFQVLDLETRSIVAMKVFPAGIVIPVDYLYHRNLVNILGVIEGREKTIVFTEYYQKNLLQIVYNSQIFMLEDVANVVYSLLKATEQMHSQGFLLKDICMEHVMLKSISGNDDSTSSMNQKLSSLETHILHFGLMKPLTAFQVELSENGLVYTPPEAYIGYLSYAFDIWAIGIILAYLLQTPTERKEHPIFTGRLVQHHLKAISQLTSPSLEELELFLKPLKFQSADVMEMKEMLKECCEKQTMPLREKIGTAPQEALALLEGMLQFIPTRRISLRHCLEHAFFQRYLKAKSSTVIHPRQQIVPIIPDYITTE